MPILFALAGATGIGKSELSLQLAERYDAEIIGVDSRQVYRGFCIGTAQPDSASLARIKHHLVDFLDPMQSFSAGAFALQSSACSLTIRRRTTSWSEARGFICKA